MKFKLNEFLDKHNILYKNQYGFRKYSSMLNATVDLIFKIQDWLDCYKLSAVLLLN